MIPVWTVLAAVLGLIPILIVSWKISQAKQYGDYGQAFAGTIYFPMGVLGSIIGVLTVLLFHAWGII